MALSQEAIAALNKQITSNQPYLSTILYYDDYEQYFTLQELNEAMITFWREEYWEFTCTLMLFMLEAEGQ